jgi:hypothetical protein
VAIAPPHGSIQFALSAPGAATHTHAESPITHMSPIALPDAGNISLDGNFPFSCAATSSPYGIITGRSSPMRHSGRRISWALGGGSLTSVARGEFGATASSGLGPRVGRSVGVSVATAVWVGVAVEIGSGVAAGGLTGIPDTANALGTRCDASCRPASPIATARIIAPNTIAPARHKVFLSRGSSRVGLRRRLDTPNSTRTSLGSRVSND